MAQSDDLRQRMARMTAQAWTDEDFNARLKTDPQGALAEHGIAVRDGTRVHVHETDDHNVHIVLPKRPGGPVVDRDDPARRISLESGGDQCYYSEGGCLETK
jgi:hypothetical protein